MFEGIGAAVSTIVVLVFMAAVGRSSRQHAHFDRDKGEFVLRASTWLRWLAIGSCVILGGIGTAALLFGLGDDDPKVLWIGLAFAVFGFGAGVILHRELTSTIVADGLGLRRHSWGSVITMAWEDIERVRWSTMMGSIVFEDSHGSKLRVGNMLRGLQDFEMLCRNRLGPERVEEAFRKLRNSGF